jgi:multiple sugar transport system substrate-binding protein
MTGSLNRRALLRGTGAALALSALPRGALAQGSETLTLWTPGGSNLFCDIHTTLLTGFAGGRPGLTGGEITCGFGDGGDYTQRLFGAIASGQVPDISMLWDSPVSLGVQGAFIELDGYMATLPGLAVENWPGGLLASCQFQGKTYGLPVTAGVWTMWFNADMFAAKGISTSRADFPKTWDEMRRLSKEFTVWDGDRLVSAGFMPPRDPAAMPIWAALNGGRLFNAAEARYEIDSPQNIEMFRYFVEWLDEEYKGDVNLIDRSGNFRDGYNDSNTGLGPAFREGRLAGLQSGSWLMGDIWAEPVPTFTNWDLAAHPTGPSGTASVSGVWPNWFVIPVGSKNPDQAAAYLEYLSTEGVKDWFRQIPDVPTNALVQADPPEVVVSNRGADYANEMAAFLQEQAGIVTPMWDSPAQSFGQDQIALAMEKIYTKAQDVEGALAEAQANAQAELERVLSL